MAKPIGFLLTQLLKAPEWHRLQLRFKKATADLFGRVISIMGDCNSPELTQLCEDNHIAKDKISLFMLNSTSSGMQLHKYKYQPAADTIAHFTLDAIKKFADDCLQLKLEPFFKSSIAPAKLQLFEKKKKAMHEQGLGYAREWNAASFHTEVMASSMNALVLFYAPYCKYSHEMMPVLDLTAQMLPSNFSLNNTVVGFLDATINDIPIPGIKPEKFPAIYFVDANNSVTEFTLQYRSLEIFLAFIMEYVKPGFSNATDPRIHHPLFTDDAVRKEWGEKQKKLTEEISNKKAADFAKGYSGSA